MKTQDMGLRRATAHRGWVPWNGPTPAHHVERRGSSAAAVMQRRISGLAGQAYEDAPAGVRAQLLEKLLRPLSPYALIAVAGGVFARIKGRNAEWQGFRIRVEDIADVDAHAIAALVDRVQQLAPDAIDGLIRVMEASPALADSSAASALIALVDRKKRTRWPSNLAVHYSATHAKS